MSDINSGQNDKPAPRQTDRWLEPGPTNALVIYILYLAGLVIGISGLVGIVVACVIVAASFDGELHTFRIAARGGDLGTCHGDPIAFDRVALNSTSAPKVTVVSRSPRHPLGCKSALCALLRGPDAGRGRRRRRRWRPRPSGRVRGIRGDAGSWDCSVIAVSTALPWRLIIGRRNREHGSRFSGYADRFRASRLAFRPIALRSMQTILHPRPARRSGCRGSRQDPARLRALRLLHRDLPDLCAARRRARFAARAHLPDQGHAGERPAGDRRGRQAHRPLPVVPRLHDHLSVGRALHASGRPRPRPYRGDLPAAAGRPADCARCWRRCCRIPAASALRCALARLGRPLRAAVRSAVGARSRLAAMLRAGAGAPAGPLGR